MGRAGKAVTGGFNIRTDAEIVRWPDRYMDERGRAMWKKVVNLLNKQKEFRSMRTSKQCVAWLRGWCCADEIVVSYRCYTGTSYKYI